LSEVIIEAGAQFVAEDSSVSMINQLLILSAIYISIELIAATGWALAGSMIRTLNAAARQLAIYNSITGVVMLGAAAMLAAARRLYV
jgi:threonine/homoserine/homoserine lactone efflux protein